MQLRTAKLAAGLPLFFGIAASAQVGPATLHWQQWSDAAFAAGASAEHKFVLLDLEAVWCHWCHVMDDITYRDPIVIRLLNERYVSSKSIRTRGRTLPIAIRIMAGRRPSSSPPTALRSSSGRDTFRRGPCRPCCRRSSTTLRRGRASKRSCLSSRADSAIMSAALLARDHSVTMKSNTTSR